MFWESAETLPDVKEHLLLVRLPVNVWVCFFLIFTIWTIKASPHTVVRRIIRANASNGEGNGNPLQYSCLENPVDRRAWWAAVYRVAQSQTRLKRLSMHWRRQWQPTPVFSLFFFFVFIYLDAPGLSCGMWDLVPWPGIKPGPSALGARSLNHWTTREVPPVFLSGESQGQGSLVGCPLWGRTESDTTEAT